MKLRKSILIFFALVLILAMMPAGVFAADGDDEPSHDVYWKYSPTEKVLIIGSQEGVNGYEAENCTEVSVFTKDDQLNQNDMNYSIPWTKAGYNDATKVVFVDKVYPRSMAYWFKDFAALSGIEGFSNLITPYVRYMNYLFSGCSNLQEIDFSGFDMSDVWDMSYMFYNCTSLTKVGLEDVDTSSLKWTDCMFRGCENLKNLYLFDFDTSTVTSMSEMFRDCKILYNMGISAFDTSSVTNMLGMFQNCEGLYYLSLQSFDTSKVEWFDNMFSGCKNIKQLNLSNFDISSATSFGEMFMNCENLKTIYVKPGTDWNTDKVQGYSGADLFYNCYSLRGGEGTVRSEDGSLDDIDAAHVDGLNGKPGLFTEKIVTINFESNGEYTGTMEPIVMGGGETLILPECGFTKEGRDFYGWKVWDGNDNVIMQSGDEFIPYENLDIETVWKYSEVREIDYYNDSSKVTFKGHLILTDTATGETVTRDLDGELLNSTFDKPSLDDVSVPIANMKLGLELEANSAAGGNALTAENVEVAEPVVLESFDNRTTERYINRELQWYPIADGEGDLYDYLFTSGECYNLWCFNVTMEAEYNSKSGEEPPVEPEEPTDITGAKVTLSNTSFTYNAKIQKPTIKTIGGMTLTKDTDYTVKWSNSSSKAAGSYTVTVTGIGNYKGTTKATYKINKAANTMSVKGLTAKVKYSKLKNGAVTLKRSTVISIKVAGQGTKTYTKTSGTSKITIAKSTGKMTVKKGLKKGTYKVSVKIKAAGSTNYKSATKTVTVTIKVI